MPSTGFTVGAAAEASAKAVGPRAGEGSLDLARLRELQRDQPRLARLLGSVPSPSSSRRICSPSATEAGSPAMAMRLVSSKATIVGRRSAGSDA